MSIQDIKNKLEFAENNTDIFEPIQVLDKGFVRLVDWYGSDGHIVDAARVSYQNGTKVVRSDAGLINYLIRNSHTSPIEHAEVCFHIKLPLFVFAHVVRHRMSSVNSASARFSVMNDEFYIPEQARSQSKTNKQGSDFDARANHHKLRNVIDEMSRISYTAYETLLGDGVAREMARMVLPQNLYTEVYWKQDLHNLLHLLRLRLDAHAQWETQQYAQAMFDITKRLFPLTVGAWERYTRDAVRFSSDEMDALIECVNKERFAEKIEASSLSAGEKREALAKLE